MASEEHQVNLFARYEQRLLLGGITRSHVIPAVVITGFLGSGKTTLVQHILRNRGSLRIAVLINEVGTVDIDSELVNAKQSNAALGLPAADLAGGCVCCARSEDLLLALRRLRDPPAPAAGAGGGGGGAGGAPCDYLLVETSGAADAGPLAEALVASGFRLDAVVAVVDAEAGPEALKHPVARAQVGCADVVVLNKCDLLAPGAGPAPGGSGPGLGALADLEDALEAMAPGVRVVRARFGEVPLTAVLDVEPVVDAGSAPHAADSGAAPSGLQGPGGGGGDGAGGGFMSHESVPSLMGRGSGGAGGSFRPAAGPLTADGLAIGSTRHAKRRALAAPPPPKSAPRLPDGSAPLGAAPAASHVETESDARNTHVRNGHRGHPPHHDHDRGQGRQHHAHHPHQGHGQGQCEASDGAAAAHLSAAPHAHTHARVHAHAHAALHSGFHTESCVAACGPCSLAAFAAFVLRRLVREPALLRSKGVLWFSERRSQRFTFHLSGRRRVECWQEGPWEGPPASQLVLIGTDAEAMRLLRRSFETEVLAAAAAVAAAPVPEPSDGAGSTSLSDASSGPRSVGIGEAAVGKVAARIAAHERLELLPRDPSAAAPSTPPAPATQSTPPQPVGGVAGKSQAPDGGAGGSGGGGGEVGIAGCDSIAGAGSGSGGFSSAGGGGGGGGGLVHFTARGSALHGIRAEELNAELARRGNATGRLMLVGVTAPGAVSAATHVQSRDRVLSLLLPVAGAAEDAEAQAEALLAAADPLLRKAYAHVHNCKCDVASSMQALKG